LKHLLFSGLSVLFFIILVLRQPDLGSALILFLFWSAMIAVVGFKKKYIITIGLVLVIVLLSGWAFFFEDYQKERIITFVNPSYYDQLDQGYNVTQAIIAVGSGGITGRGVGFGSQSQLKFLPEAQNDFIFAVIAEELGFLGFCLVLTLFAVFFYRMLSSIKKIDDDFGIYFIIGTTVLIFIEMFINIGMNIGILPVIGISLPFLSYGGSAIVSTLMLVGIVENIIIRSKMKY
jgi:rod shape determining protein RodA